MRKTTSKRPDRLSQAVGIPAASTDIAHSTLAPGRTAPQALIAPASASQTPEAPKSDLSHTGLTEEQQKLVGGMIAEGFRRMNAPRQTVNFKTPMPEAEYLLNDLEHYPHVFVLGCVMDRQMSFSRAWAIPLRVGKAIDGWRYSDFARVTLSDLTDIFAEQALHRFGRLMAKNFYAAVHDIGSKYAGDAAKIWGGNPKGAAVVRRFLEFKGVGIKIANMAAIMLLRDFKVPMQDWSSIDIAPDVRVTRFFEHHGLLRHKSSQAELIYLARELCSQFPGALDIVAFENGSWRQLGGAKS